MTTDLQNKNETTPSAASDERIWTPSLHVRFVTHHQFCIPKMARVRVPKRTHENTTHTHTNTKTKIHRETRLPHIQNIKSHTRKHSRTLMTIRTQRTNTATATRRTPASNDNFQNYNQDHGRLQVHISKNSLGFDILHTC